MSSNKSYQDNRPYPSGVFASVWGEEDDNNEK